MNCDNGRERLTELLSWEGEDGLKQLEEAEEELSGARTRSGPEDGWSSWTAWKLFWIWRWHRQWLRRGNRRMAGREGGEHLETKEDLIRYCLTYKDVYEDYPFRDQDWTVIRHRGSRKVFAWIYHRNGSVCVNVKCRPDWVRFWQEAFAGVKPGYHLNKKYWNTVILDGTVPDDAIKQMIGESYDLTGGAAGRD